MVQSNFSAESSPSTPVHDSPIFLGSPRIPGPLLDVFQPVFDGLDFFWRQEHLGGVPFVVGVVGIRIVRPAYQVVEADLQTASEPKQRVPVGLAPAALENARSTRPAPAQSRPAPPGRTPARFRISRSRRPNSMMSDSGITTLIQIDLTRHKTVNILFSQVQRFCKGRVRRTPVSGNRSTDQEREWRIRPLDRHGKVPYANPSPLYSDQSCPRFAR